MFLYILYISKSLGDSYIFFRIAACMLPRGPTTSAVWNVCELYVAVRSGVQVGEGAFSLFRVFEEISENSWACYLSLKVKLMLLTLKDLALWRRHCGCVQVL